MSMQFAELEQLFDFQTKEQYCVEIEFSVSGCDAYGCCWMGKLFDKQEERDVYWYGLLPDGSEAYDYHSFEEMASDRVFDGSNLKEIWERVTIREIDGCAPSERMNFYLA